MTQKQKTVVPKSAKPAKVKATGKTLSAASKAAPPRTLPRSATKILSENEVRQRAYSLWESRGCPFGSPEVDWYRAKELLGPEKSS